MFIGRPITQEFRAHLIPQINTQDLRQAQDAADPRPLHLVESAERIVLDRGGPIADLRLDDLVGPRSFRAIASRISGGSSACF
jgi:hypothetical protein